MGVRGRIFSFDIWNLNTGETAPWFQYYYDAASNETKRYNYFNGIAQEYTRDSLNRIARVDLKKSGATLDFEGYGFDAMSREVYVTHGKEWTTDVFDYDNSGQLTSAQYKMTLSGTVWGNPQRTMSYVWDNAGNRSGVTENGVGNGYVSNSLNQYTNARGAALTNGAHHEARTYLGLTYSYFNDERLKSVTGGGNSYSLAYDALGRCVKRTLNGVITYYVYDGEKPILEYKSTGAMAGNNVYGKGIDEILMRGDYVVAPSGQGYFYQQDGNGNVTHLTSFQGTVIEQYKYDAFGQPTTTYSGGVFNNRFKFTGREWAERFGFYEYRARAYHPTLGRFMSEDPSGFAGGDYNLFGYCGNDPLNEVDPMGLQAGHIRLRPPPSGYEMDDGFLGKKIAQARAEADLTMADQRRVEGNKSTSSAIERATALPGTRDGRRSDTKRGALYISRYGDPDDKTPDSNTRQRKGAWENRLDKNSVALSRDLERHIPRGRGVYVNDHYIGDFDDRTPRQYKGVKFVKTIDVYDPHAVRGQHWGVIMPRGTYTIMAGPSTD